MGLHTLPEQVWFAAMTVVSLFALWRGGRTERFVAWANLAAWVASRLVFNAMEGGALQWGVLAVDVGFLGLLIFAAMSSNRSWTLFAAAFQLLGVVIHLATMVDSDIMMLTYMRGLVIWSYLVLVSMAWGTWQIVRERRYAP